ncbi:MAG: lamin tail domain-containing protein [Bacteroidota bacterium]
MKNSINIFSKRLLKLIILILLLPNFNSFGQCSVVINEIMFSPSSGPGNSLYDNGANSSQTSEWVEIYNPSSCNPVDISCWILGSDQTNAMAGGANYGAFVFPNGTIIPPLGFLVIGGNTATPKDFNVQTSSQYCGNTRWFLSNTAGWIGLYDNTGAVIDAVYWSNTGSTALSSSPAFNNSLISNQTISCKCSGFSNNMLAKNITGIEFAGSSSGGLGEGFKRTIDGGTTWQIETVAQSTPKACNGACNIFLSNNKP